MSAPHLLSLRVLRASRPTLATREVPYAESSQSAVRREQGCTAPLDGSFSLTGLYQLPSSFGNLHLGETFRAAVVLAHDGIANETAHGSTLRLEMDAPSRQKIFLSESAAGRDLSPGEHLEMQAEWELKEAGPHALICTVTYCASGVEEPRSFRKLFRFNVLSHTTSYRGRAQRTQVTNPLSVRTKVHGVDSPLGSLSPHREVSYLEVQISNTAPPPALMHFERIAFDAAEGMICEPASSESTEPFALEAGTVRQHLFILRPKEGPPSEAFAKSLVAGTLPLGKLDLNWRTSEGEPGRLQTSTLVRKMGASASATPAPHLSYTPRSPARSPQIGYSAPIEVALAVLQYPARVLPEQTFEVKVKLTGKARLEGFRPPARVAEQMASLLDGDHLPVDETEGAVCLDCKPTSEAGVWTTRWLAAAAAGEVIEVGGLRAVGQEGKVLKEWRAICTTWLVEQASL